MSDAETQYCTFHVADLLFGVRVRGVQEVLRHQVMTPVPLAAGPVRGLINLRGQIVTAVDLRRRLGYADRDPGEDGEHLPLNVVVHSGGEATSLLVDAIGDVLDIGNLDLLPTPANLPDRVRDLVHGVVALPDAILLVLDTDRAVDVSDHSDGGTP